MATERPKICNYLLMLRLCTCGPEPVDAPMVLVMGAAVPARFALRKSCRDHDKTGPDRRTESYPLRSMPTAYAGWRVAAPAGIAWVTPGERRELSARINAGFRPVAGGCGMTQPGTRSSDARATGLASHRFGPLAVDLPGRPLTPTGRLRAGAR
jgi:hypothetical protein